MTHTRDPSRVRGIRLALATACLLVVAASPCHAQTFGVHVASHHFPATAGQNNVNPGVYVRLDNGFTAGAYRNTLRRVSFYAGYTASAGPFALTVGAVTGYQKRVIDSATGEWEGISNGPVTLMLAPSVALPEVLGVVPRLSVIPRFGVSRNTVVHLSFERRF